MENPVGNPVGIPDSSSGSPAIRIVEQDKQDNRGVLREATAADDAFPDVLAVPAGDLSKYDDDLERGRKQV